MDRVFLYQIRRQRPEAPPDRTGRHHQFCADSDTNRKFAWSDWCICLIEWLSQWHFFLNPNWCYSDDIVWAGERKNPLQVNRGFEADYKNNVTRTTDIFYTSPALRACSLKGEEGMNKSSLFGEGKRNITLRGLVWSWVLKLFLLWFRNRGFFAVQSLPLRMRCRICRMLPGWFRSGHRGRRVCFCLRCQ